MFNFYPRPPRGGRPGPFRWPFSTLGISIHALREEGDLLRLFLQHCTYLFLSTPSARRATYRITSVNILPGYFYPRPPRGGRPITLFHVSAELVISIHALREEGDRPVPPVAGRSMYFYPRPPRGGRRLVRYSLGRHPEISIHALREEGDSMPCTNPNVFIIFLSTPSARRATKSWAALSCASLFLSTPSARRATRQLCAGGQHESNFYPRPPRGGRRRDFLRRDFGDVISIHALREEGDVQYFQHYIPSLNFYPRPPRGGRPGGFSAPSTNILFLSTPSARRATRAKLPPCPALG